MCYLSYSKCIEVLKLYSLQRRSERYGIIYVWKVVEGLVPNHSDPITCSFSDRRGITCVVCHITSWDLFYKLFTGNTIELTLSFPNSNIFILSQTFFGSLPLLNLSSQPFHPPLKVTIPTFLYGIMINHTDLLVIFNFQQSC